MEEHKPENLECFSGLPVLEEIVRLIPEEVGSSFVILQHLPSQYKSLTPDLEQALIAVSEVAP